MHILPFLGEDALYQQFRLDEPSDSPHNAALLDKMPATYQSPGVTLPAGHTCWLATVGERSLIALPGDRRSWGPGFLGIKNGDILDGSSQTFVFVEVNPSAAVPWTAPRDYQYDLQNPLREFGGIRPGPSFLAAFADARIVALRPSSPNIEDTMQRVYQRDDWTEKEAQDYVDEP